MEAEHKDSGSHASAGGVSRLIMPRACAEQIRDDARSRVGGDFKSPDATEACGLLLGYREGARVVVSAVISTPNDANSAAGFTINPYQVFKAVRVANGGGERVVGIYHSHIGYGARPSAIDVGRMLPYTKLTWLIYDTLDDEMRAYSAPDGEVVEVPLDVV